MIDRRSRILELAQRELVAAHGRRRARRTALAAASALAVVATGIVIALMLRGNESATTHSPADTAIAGHDAPGTPSTRPAPTPAPAPAMASRFEVVTATTPSRGFAEILDDRGLAAALEQLPGSTGMAVVGGRARIVPNAVVPIEIPSS